MNKIKYEPHYTRKINKSIEVGHLAKKIVSNSPIQVYFAGKLQSNLLVRGADPGGYIPQKFDCILQ